MPQTFEDFIKDIEGNESFQRDQSIKAFYKNQENNQLSAIKNTLETTKKSLLEENLEENLEEMKKKLEFRISILEKLIKEKENGPIQEAPQEVIQSQEEKTLKELIVLFRRIYDAAEGEAIIAFNNNDQKYLTHALIQSALYNMKQECSILFSELQCLNDGTSAVPMSLDSFKNYMNTKQINPINRETIKEETYHFYDCVTGTNTYNKDSLAAYKAQYERAQLMLMGLLPLKGIPKDVKDFIEKSNIKIPFQIQNVKNVITNASSAEEIKQLLEDISKNSNATSEEEKTFQKAIKELLEKKELKKQFDEAKLGCFEQFKNFVLKCVYTIFYYIQWILSSEKANSRDEKISIEYKEIDNNERVKTFKDLVCTEIDNPQVIQV